MSQHFATQCPECQSRFQVTLEQLNKAQGLVRCGACMKVFAADQCLQTQEPSASQNLTAEAEGDSGPRIPHIPIQLQRQPPRGSTLRFLSWSLLCLLAIAGLGAQVLWFERDKYAGLPLFEPLYATACQYLDCQFQPRQDLPSLKAKHLVIRDHPDFLNAIAVDLLMENTAPFPQPFPAIQLIFSGINGDPKAARVFQPEEYLGGDFQQSKLIPSQRQVRISLELIDPGQQAPNYSLSFVSPRR